MRASEMGKPEPRDVLYFALSSAKKELAAIDDELQKRVTKAKRVWGDEEPALQAYATTMAQTADVMRADLEKLKRQRLAYQRSAAQDPSQAASAADAAAKKEVAELTVEIERLEENMRAIDKQLADCRARYASETSLDTKALLETQLVALQETKNITKAEVERLRVGLATKERESQFKEQEKQLQAQILQQSEEVNGIVAKVDRAKQLIYFPSVDGFRFRSGSAGIFVGSKDVFISELSISFYLSCKRVVGKDGRVKSVLSLRLGGDPPRASNNGRTGAGAAAPQPGAPFRSTSGSARSMPGAERQVSTSMASAGSTPTSGLAQQVTTRFSVPAAVGLPSAAQPGADSPELQATPTSAANRQASAPVRLGSLDSAAAGTRLAVGPEGAGKDTHGRSNSASACAGQPIAEANESSEGAMHAEVFGAAPASALHLGAAAGGASTHSSQVFGSSAASGELDDVELCDPGPEFLPDTPAAGSGSNTPNGRARFAAAFQNGRSRGKQLTMGLMDKLSKSKRFGKQDGPDGAATDSAAARMPTPRRNENGLRGSILSKIKSGSDVDPARERQSMRAKLSSAKKGVAAVGSFVRQTGSKAGKAVNRTVEKIGEKGGAAIHRLPLGRNRSGRYSNQAGADDADSGRLSDRPLSARLSDRPLSGRLSRQLSTTSSSGAPPLQLPVRDRGGGGGADDDDVDDLPEPEVVGVDEAASSLLDLDLLPSGPVEAPTPTASAPAAAADPFPPSLADVTPRATLSAAAVARASAAAEAVAGSVPSSLHGAGSGSAASEVDDDATTIDWQALDAPSVMSSDALSVDAAGASGKRACTLRLQASNVKVVGERGSKVPNMTIKDLGLLLECLIEAHFEWTDSDGWVPAQKLKLQILKLEHTISYTTVPVPRALLKYLLNMMLPALIETRLLSVLPTELGAYFTDPITPGVQLGGSMTIIGPPLKALNVDLTMDRVPQASFAGMRRASRTARLVAAAAEARAMMGLTLDQCQVVADLTASKHSCILPQRLEGTTMSCLCRAVSTLMAHPDLLQRWRAAMHDALQVMCTWRNVPLINWHEVCETVLEPAVRKPLRIRFVVTCFDLSTNINGLVSAVRDHFFRTAQSEASSSTLASNVDAQLKALDALHSWLLGFIHAFLRRFKHARASLLAGLDASSLKLFLEDVRYQGPMHLEVPLEKFSEILADGSVSFGVELPTSMAFKRSVALDLMRALLGDPEAADEAYLERAAASWRRSSKNRQVNGGETTTHELLKEIDAVEVKQSDKEVLEMGMVQLNSVGFKMVLEDDLLQSMLGGSVSGNITADSLGRVLQCFGPCLNVAVGSTALRANRDAVFDDGSRKPGVLLSSGEICNAQASCKSIGYVSSMSPLRLIRLAHTTAVTLAANAPPEEAPPQKTTRLDSVFHALAHYFGSDALDLSVALQAALVQVGNSLQLQLLGCQPAGEDGDGQAACISFTNDVDMLTVLNSLDASQGTPVDVA